jgi:hypothetical protein
MYIRIPPQSALNLYSSHSHINPYSAGGNSGEVYSHVKVIAGWVVVVHVVCLIPLSDDVYFIELQHLGYKNLYPYGPIKTA